jgi:hypothetical protein
MIFVVTLSNPPSEQVLCEAESVIQAWGLRSGVPDTVVSRLVSCFDSKFLLSLPRLAGFKRGKFSPSQIHCYLWYRQAAKALGWRDRQKFPTEIEDLLKVRVWPDGEAEIGDAPQIDRPNNAHKINLGTSTDGGGLAACGHVPRIFREWGDVVHTDITVAARKGSPREEQFEDSGPGSTSAEEPVSARVRGCGSVTGTNSGDPFRTSVEDKAWDGTGVRKCRRAGGGIIDGCAGRSESVGSCPTAHHAQADAHKGGCDRSIDDRDGGGWTAKRSRVDR